MTTGFLTLEQSLAMRPLTTTLARIRACSPCGIDPRNVPLTGYQKLKAHLGSDHGDETAVAFATIVASNGIDDALWCLRAEPRHGRLWRLMAVRLARQVQHLMTDERSIAALEVAERFAHGDASEEEMDAARGAARDAAWGAARGAREAARGAASGAAWAARDAAWAAWEAARGAAREASWEAAWAAWEAARGAAREADGDGQKAIFLEMVGEIE